MLKDLDQRQHDQVNNAGVTATLQNNNGTKSWLLIVITVLVTLAIMVAGYLYYQNQQLSAQLLKQKKSSQISVQKIQQTALQSQQQKPQLKLKPIPEKVINQPSVITAKSAEVVAVNKAKLPVSTVITTEPEIQTGKVLAETNDQKNEKITNAGSVENTNKNIKATTKANTSHLVVESSRPSMTVSRHKLSAEQLAQQKMTNAQEMINLKQLKQAEKLFEEILMLTPNNKAARKQLAALWFGRTAYQSALNLLSQGIALDDQDSEFRLMQARIYLKLGDNEKALQVLQAYKQVDNVEYLVTMANIAQQLTKYAQAITAYKRLANIQPSEAKWWLGLAVAYDSDAQYSLAITAYQSAIAQGNLSNSALQFAKQRLQELEE